MEIMNIMIRNGWDCYPEVGVAGSFPDILGFKNNLTWIVETKMMASLSVLDQSSSWLGCVNFVSIGLPKPPKNECFKKICKDWGIGLFGLGSHYVSDIIYNQEGFREDSSGSFRRDGYDKSHEIIHPRFFRKTVYSTNELRAKTNPLMKDFLPGGTSADGRFSPWRHTMNQAVEYITNNPRCRTADIVKNIDHHYRTDANAHSSLLQWLRTDLRVESALEGRYVVYFMKED